MIWIKKARTGSVIAFAVIVGIALAGYWYVLSFPGPDTASASDTAAQAKDLVCGMDVDKATAKTAHLTSEYQGNTYYFCSDHCKKEFDKNPAGYVKERKGTDQVASKQIDPVCRMEVSPATAKHNSQYQGKTYYFCSESCKKKFDANPGKYLKQD